MEENNVVADNSNTAEPVVAETTNETNDEMVARLAKAEELANNYKIRAEKAEKLAKSVETPKQVDKKSTDISSKDMYALFEAKVPQEDVDEVVDWARYKGISVSEALKSTTIKATLQERNEQRATAAVSHTGNAKRGSTVVSDESILENAAKGRLPETDDAIRRLVEAKYKSKK